MSLARRECDPAHGRSNWRNASVGDDSPRSRVVRVSFLEWEANGAQSMGEAFACTDMSAAVDVTDFLDRAAHGDARAIDALMPEIYASLRQLASRQRARESARTLETTALVHEAYLVLARHSSTKFDDRAHFYAYMSRVMRHLLVDHARRRKALKRQAPAEGSSQPDGGEDDAILDVLALDEALQRLAANDARLARVAEILDVNPRTVERDWLKARTFLCGCLLPAG
jgi:RNA polymerase sigma factor (TIGR02999 family)